MIGSNLAQYKVTAALGEGGMGQVWRAEDSKLGREVALKVLPEEFAEDPERMARFEREARVLANLNHPNIATLYGLETVASDAGVSPTIFLAMELVEGEDLSERITTGPIPVEEAVAIALQIAEALEAAHEQGIVHRDLKPANIKLRPDGTVKVLDFGLAKAWEAEGPDAGLSLSPTVTRHNTAAGLILGTAAYMAPEQAAGIAVDRRADIWAFGVVFWEMLTGHKLFEGETVSHVLASVLKDEVDLDELPPETPLYLKKLVGRCLRKVLATGGPVQTICNATDGKGGTWNRDGVIVFAPDSATTLSRVAAVGGEPTPITELDLERGDNSHRQPRFLPDGQHLLFYARNSGGDNKGMVRVIGLDEGGSGRDVVQSPASPWFAAGHLLYLRERILMAQPFDPDKAEFRGDGFPLAENVVVRSLTGAGGFSATDDGVLVYQTGTQDEASRLQWFDRDGVPGAEVGEESVYDQVTLSPDGTTAAVVIFDTVSGTEDIWLVDIERGLRTRFTFDKASDNYPVWSPDGQSLLFASRRGGVRGIYRKSIGGSGDVEVVYATDVDVFPTSWSPDGRFVAFNQPGQGTGSDQWILDLEGGPSAEVFYQEENGPLKRVAVDGRGDTFTVGAVEDVMVLGTAVITGVKFSVTPDGEKVLAAVNSQDEQSPFIDLVVGWTAGLEEKQ